VPLLAFVEMLEPFIAGSLVEVIMPCRGLSTRDEMVRSGKQA
jgi:hypothetical protein